MCTCISPSSTQVGALAIENFDVCCSYGTTYMGFVLFKGCSSVNLWELFLLNIVFSVDLSPEIALGEIKKRNKTDFGIMWCSFWIYVLKSWQKTLANQKDYLSDQYVLSCLFPVVCFENTSVFGSVWTCVFVNCLVSARGQSAVSSWPSPQEINSICVCRSAHTQAWSLLS